ncbi:1-propanol dehydrogenase PduQ [Clostridium sp.]|jgi:1-propanol dehydrogenase|uniref:1-propanol dehydrogenase PduQ n=1 Tax=Clostridium sp. TaxID=1506 RepID=UPI003EEEFA81
MKTFKVPAKILHEGNSIKYLEELKSDNVFIVTDKVMFELGMTKEITKILDKLFIKYEVFCKVEPEPTMEIVTNVLKKFVSFKADTIIAVGGGSVIDTSKAIIYFMDMLKDKVEDEILPKPFFIAIPTTSGTGSEVTSYAVITDSQENKKITLKDNVMYADVAIIDAEFTKTVPSFVMADTAMDALTHALEAFVSNNASDCTDALAQSAIENIFEHVVRVYKNGLDTISREKIHIPSCMAGIAFENASLGINHSLAHAIGAEFKISHGKANAILLPYIIEFNCGLFDENEYNTFETAKKYAKIANILRLPNSDFKEGVVMLVKSLKVLNSELNIPLTIKDLGIKESVFNESLDELCERALDDLCTLGNPRKATKEELCNILKTAYLGH